MNVALSQMEWLDILIPVLSLIGVVIALAVFCRWCLGPILKAVLMLGFCVIAAVLCALHCFAVVFDWITDKTSAIAIWWSKRK